MKDSDVYVHGLVFVCWLIRVGLVCLDAGGVTLLCYCGLIGFRIMGQLLLAVLLVELLRANHAIECHSIRFGVGSLYGFLLVAEGALGEEFAVTV